MLKAKEIPLEFTEDMHGHFSENTKGLTFPVTQKNHLLEFKVGESKNNELTFRLTIKIADIDTFCNDISHKASATGIVTSAFLGGELKVIEGSFNLFTRHLEGPELNIEKEMHYHLKLENDRQVTFTMFGYKTLEKEDLFEGWDATTTLYMTLYKGHVEEDQLKSTPVLGVGILRLNLFDFMKQMTTFRSVGHSGDEMRSALFKFLSLFADNLWEAYAPAIFFTEKYRWNEHLIPLRSDSGVRAQKKSLIRFNTPDGLSLELNRFHNEKTKDVVLLLHGLTTSTDMFIMPEHYNLVQYLLDHGLSDVWSLDWRGSNRFTYNLEPHRYTMDDIAQNDYPSAILKIIEEVGSDVRIHVICHCVGSLSFMCALSAGVTKNIASVISNSVSLHPRVSKMALIKSILGPDIFEHLFGYAYISPKIPYFPGPRFGKWIAIMERLIRHECKEPSCHMSSFLWGWGFPAIYLHQNINPMTHRRLPDLFGGTSFHYFRHMRKMIFKKRAIHYVDETQDYFNLFIEQKNIPPLLLISGDKNLIFPKSNLTTMNEIKKIKPDAPVYYREFKDYGHQDIFMGNKSFMNVFPELVSFIKKSIP
jgi:triacylglycerol lipase/cholesterol oxidase